LFLCWQREINFPAQVAIRVIDLDIMALPSAAHVDARSERRRIAVKL
jgi:hypothetical protein